MLSGRFWTEAAIFLGVSAMEGQFLQVGPHRAPSASGARGVGDLRRTGLALIERCAQPFDRYRTIGQPTIAKQVCERLGDREDRNIDSGNCVARSEEHTSELQSLMRISYAVFCLKKKKTTDNTTNTK